MDAPVLPRVAVVFCTQCRWMLRAAYFAQELLSTFGTDLGEVALQPATGGVFRVTLEWEDEAGVEMPRFYRPGQVEGLEQPDAETSSPADDVCDEGRHKTKRHVLLWDRKAEAGFPETKVLKQRVRDCVQPGRGLGHSDVGGKAGADAARAAAKSRDSQARGPQRDQSQDAASQNTPEQSTGAASVAAGGGQETETGMKKGRDDCETCP